MKTKIIIGIVIAATVFAVIALGAKSIGISAKNSASAENTRFESYEIKPNDTLWSIAKSRSEALDMSEQEYIRAVKELNHLKTDTIVAGQKLIVLYSAPAVEVCDNEISLMN